MDNKQQFRVQVVDLQKSYTNKKKQSVVPLYKCNLGVYPEEIFVILGESGSGKSSLLKVIAGSEPYDFGDVYIDGMDASTISQADKNMSYVSQNIVLFPHKTIYQNLMVPLEIMKYSKEEMIMAINYLSDLFSIKNLLTRKPSELSGGQQQRVAIARSMAKKPSICLFDEPLASLDPRFHDEILMTLKSVQKKTLSTFIYATHDQKEAFAIGDRIGVLNNRKFEQIGTFEDFEKHPNTLFVAEFLNYIYLLTLECMFRNNELVNEKIGFHMSLSEQHKSALRKYKDKKLKVALRRKNIEIFEKGDEFPILTNLESSIITNIDGKEITLDVDNPLSEKAKTINLKFNDVDLAVFFEENNVLWIRSILI